MPLFTNLAFKSVLLVKLFKLIFLNKSTFKSFPQESLALQVLSVVIVAIKLSLLCLIVIFIFSFKLILVISKYVYIPFGIPVSLYSKNDLSIFFIAISLDNTVHEKAVIG